MKSAAEEVEQRILILAPIGRDAQAAARQLTTSGLVCLICHNLNDLCDQLANGGGAALIAEEAFVRESSESLSRWAARQPAWSDFPFVVLTGHQTSASAQAHRLQLLNSLGNVSLLERPLGSVTLVSALKTALRARRRQYEVQDYLLERELSAAHMEDLVRERTQQLQDTNQQLRLEIAERKQAEAALQQAQKMELIGQMTGGVAHDFNNLLTAVLGNLELASHRNADAKIRRYLAGATHAAQRGAKLTSQLLAFSRRQRLETEPTDLNALVWGMSDLLFRTIGSTIRIEPVLQKGLWPALVDASQIELVILNLAINARDAMPGGGRLTITTSNVNIQDAERPRELAGGEYVVVSVSDTGTGMTEEVLKKVFEPFFTTKAIGSGTGLGLSQVYGIAKQTGGGVRIDTKFGSGTTVTVYLPRAQGRPLEHPAGREPTRSLPTRSATVLVADDDHDVRDLTAACLDSLGYSVLVADSGRSAIEIVSSNALIDLLMIDIAMPEMNGVEAGRAISAQRPELPIIYMTGYVDSSALDGQGQRRLLKKPFTVAELELRVEEALGANDDEARAASLVSATPASCG
jgi:signal transduction histidine kinase/CheY-like chemotaxis protein